MAAIATIADAVPLKGENRVIAALGLRELRRPAGAGLRALFAAAALDPAAKAITGFDVAFRLAPRINAAGRMDVASEVIELFTTRDAARAAELAAKLERLNRERRETEAAALTAIESPPGRRRRTGRRPPAGHRRRRLASRRHRHSGLARGRAHRQAGHRGQRRGRRGLRLRPLGGRLPAAQRHRELRRSLHALRRPRLRRGLCPARRFALPELKRRLRLYAEEHLAAREPERLLRIHAELPLDRITPVLAGWLRKLEPFGHGNPEPVFVARKVRLLAPPRIMKERHIRLELAQDSVQPQPLPGSSGALRAVGWHLAARAAELWPRAGSSLIDLAYRIRENEHPEYGGLEALLSLLLLSLQLRKIVRRRRLIGEIGGVRLPGREIRCGCGGDGRTPGIVSQDDLPGAQVSALGILQLDFDGEGTRRIGDSERKARLLFGIAGFECYAVLQLLLPLDIQMALQSRHAGGDRSQIVPSLRAARKQGDGGEDDSKQNSKTHADRGIDPCWILREPPHPYSSPLRLRKTTFSSRRQCSVRAISSHSTCGEK
jgi:hypothetical protein